MVTLQGTARSGTLKKGEQMEKRHYKVYVGVDVHQQGSKRLPSLAVY